MDDGSFALARLVAEDEGIAVSFVEEVIRAAQEYTARVEKNRHLATSMLSALGFRPTVATKPCCTSCGLSMLEDDRGEWNPSICGRCENERVGAAVANLRRAS